MSLFGYQEIIFNCQEQMLKGGHDSLAFMNKIPRVRQDSGGTGD